MSCSSSHLTRTVIPRPAASSNSTTGQGIKDGHVTVSQSEHVQLHTLTHITHFFQIPFHDPILDLTLTETCCETQRSKMPSTC